MDPLARLSATPAGAASATAGDLGAAAPSDGPQAEGEGAPLADAGSPPDFTSFLEFAGLQPAIASPDDTSLPPPPAATGNSLPQPAGELPKMEPLLALGRPDGALPAAPPFQLEQLLDGKGRLPMTSSLNLPGEQTAAVDESWLNGGMAAIQRPAAAARAVPVMGLRLDMPVGQPEWSQALGERLQWMVGRNIQQAEVRLSPPHLGPLEIRVALQHDQASVSFVAHHAATRDAIEAALPRLREMLGEANINLADVDVGQRDPRAFDQQQGQPGGGGRDQGNDDREAADAVSLRPLQPASRGLLDEIA